jgi:hypothetical protein
MLGIPHSAVTNALRDSGVKMRPQRNPVIVTELSLTNPHHPRIERVQTGVVVRNQVRLTPKLAYLMGWIVGDGYANKREIDAIVSLRERKIIEPIVIRLLSQFGKILVVPRHGALIVRCLSTKLARVLCTPTGKRFWTNVGMVPQSRRFAAWFIAGFWDADGGVFHEDNGAFRAHLYNSNLPLLRKISRALKRHFGITVRLYKRKRNSESSLAKIHQRSDRFDLYVRASSNQQWKRFIAVHMTLPWKKPLTVRGVKRPA